MSEPTRVIAKVLVVAEGATRMAHVVVDGERDPIIVPAERIALEANLPVNELPGRTFTAVWTVTESGDELSEFHLMNDPRI